jgi:hypothetical protein
LTNFLELLQDDDAGQSRISGTGEMREQFIQGLFVVLDVVELCIEPSAGFSRVVCVNGHTNVRALGLGLVLFLLFLFVCLDAVAVFDVI